MSKINKKDLKRLAQQCAYENTIDKNTYHFIMGKLSVSELKFFLDILRNELSKNSVTVISAEQLTIHDKSEITKDFKGKRIAFERNEELGAGMIIKDSDNILDLSLKGAIIHTVESVKETL